MRIEKIILNNFGSYEGTIIFDTQSSEDKNIILVGGKNGTGKTTLFTAIRLCLYGYMSLGYKNKNSYYAKAITKLINNNAKVLRPASASVALYISINNGQGLDKYSIARSWILTDTIEEEFIVQKNMTILTETETADFEKYILSLIPPELFNLYFFDGEKIADFFLDEGSNSRIKDAFLTLCGYDTFEIMRKNFKRISSKSKSDDTFLMEYIRAKDNYEKFRTLVSNLEIELQKRLDDINNVTVEIETLDKIYKQEGGISEEESNKKMLMIKEEEKKREIHNAVLKRWANDLVPFLMIRDKVEDVKKQISAENSELKYRHFSEILEDPTVKKLIPNTDEILKTAYKIFGENCSTILDLSFEQSALILSQTKSILEFKPSKILERKNEIKESIALSAQIRQELENKSTDTVQNYMKNKALLFEKKSQLLSSQVSIQNELNEKINELKNLEAQYIKSRAKLEDSLKQKSIHDISARAIIMLDNLQAILYQKQILKVEKNFRKEISILMRKKNFINDIHIDNNFGIHIYKASTMKVSTLKELIKQNNKEQFQTLMGQITYDKLLEKLGTDKYEILPYKLSNFNFDEIEIPVEIDKSSLSNGEKQIFIMAFYHSLIQLCNHEIPFIIDTPFARIDTEHRINISKYFFNNLSGQIFILSTNEEINSKHFKILNEKIAETYMLENIDNTKTIVHHNKYFEV